MSVTELVQRFFSDARPNGVASAYVFGSHARGTSHAESDVDVGIVLQAGGPSGRDAAELATRLASELVAATHRNEVDVVILNRAPPELAVAATAGQRVYCADAEADRAFVRTALLRLGDLRPFLERARRRKLAVLQR